MFHHAKRDHILIGGWINYGAQGFFYSGLVKGFIGHGIEILEPIGRQRHKMICGKL
jgi:hypothetical protein